MKNKLEITKCAFGCKNITLLLLTILFSCHKTDLPPFNNCQISKYSQFINDRIGLEYTNTFNSKGLIRTHIEYLAGNQTSYYECEYDASNRLIKLWSQDGHPNANNYNLLKEFIYNAEGKKEKTQVSKLAAFKKEDIKLPVFDTVFIYQNGNLIKYYSLNDTTEFNSQGLISREAVKNINESRITLYEYDANKNLLKEKITISQANANTTLETFYKYNNKNQDIERQFFTNNQLSDINIKEYDSNDRLLKFKSYQKTKDNLLFSRAFEYTPTAKILNEKDFDSNGILTSTKAYQYDNTDKLSTVLIGNTKIQYEYFCQ
jgi:hypothetical protein